MIILKAIEILQLAIKDPGSVNPLDNLKAQDLSIEALKRIQQGRLHPFNPMYTPLTGETMPGRGIQAVMQSRQAKKTKQA